MKPVPGANQSRGFAVLLQNAPHPFPGVNPKVLLQATYAPSVFCVRFPDAPLATRKLSPFQVPQAAGEVVADVVDFLRRAALETALGYFLCRQPEDG